MTSLAPLRHQGPHTPVHHVARDATSLGDLLRRRMTRSPDQAAFYHKHQGAWIKTSWRDAHQHAAQVAQGLLALDLPAQERVAILGPTSPSWCRFDLGAQLLGLVSIGIYPQQSVEQLRYLYQHSEARVLFVDGEPELERSLQAAQDLPSLKAIIPWTEALYLRCRERDPRLRSPTLFQQALTPQTQRAVETRLRAVDPDHTAILIYTSGTTGHPKAVMISHRNILALLGGDDSGLELYDDDITLVFLPMAHSAERIFSFYGRVSSGMAAAYASSTGAVLTEIQEVRPTFFGAVPRIFEKAYSKIHSEVEHKPAAVRRLFAWATKVGRARIRHLLRGETVPPLLALQHQLADRLVFRRIRQAFGGRVRQFIVGAAPVAKEMLEFFWAAGLPIYEAYGMTEATVITHINRPTAVRLGSVGKIIPPMEARVAEDGEILLRGPFVCQGYFKDPAATAETLAEGWLHTGDIGRIDPDGYLYITDRKKHLIITAGGKNVTPANIEAAIKTEEPLISQVHAHGDRRPYVSALLCPSPIETLQWGAERGLVSREQLMQRSKELMDDPIARSPLLHQDMAKVVEHPDFVARLVAAVERGNRRLAHVEQVRRVRILPRDLCQEHGELTPTMKMKRKEIEARYAADFDRIYEQEGFGLPVPSTAL